MSERSERLRAWIRRRALGLELGALLVVLAAVYLAPDLFYSVYPGQSAVLWKRFGGGTVVDRVYSEGFHVKFPWDRVYIYDIRLQEKTETFNALSADGLAIDVTVSTRFRIQERGLGALHRNIGPQYVDRLILPEVGAFVREEIALYLPEELYSVDRAEIQRKILEKLRQGLRVRYQADGGVADAVFVEDVLIRGIVLPPLLAEAITQKLTEKQRFLEYQFRIAREEQEKRRKQIEAEGIRAFQDIVAEGISERYLKWKGIDATLKLAESPNSKIVVIGAGRDGLPIILGGLEAPAAEAPRPPGAAPRPPPPR